MTAISMYCTVFSLLIGLVTVAHATLDDAKELHSELLKEYNKYVRPVRNQTATVNIYVSLAVIAIQEFDEVLERFSVAGAFFLNWIDENMVWETKDHGGVESVFMGYRDVWVPELILTNPSEKLDSYGKQWQLIRYSFYGLASWQPGDLIKSTCSVNVRYFPFDIQECNMDFYTWGYLRNEVALVPTRTDIDTSLLAEHGSWKVLNTSVRIDDVDYVSKIIFTFKLQRKPQYVIVNVVLPILFLCLLNVLVFVLPAESGERVSYAITVLLSIAVFMTIVSDTLPKSSEPLPLIAYFLMIDLIISALISLLTVLNLRTFHKKDDVPIPKWLTRIYNILRCNCRQNGSIGNYEKDETLNTLPLSKNNTPFKHAFKLHVDKRTDISDKEHSGRLGDFKTAIESIDSETDKSKTAVTWQDISVLIDHILLVVFTVSTMISFTAFIIITKTQSV